MVTRWQTSAQQYNNRTVDNTVNVALGPCRVWFVADVVGVNTGATATFMAQFLGAGGQVLHGVASSLRSVGRSSIGSRLPAGTTQMRVFLDVSGRMSMAFRIVTFDIAEDVPEAF